MLNFLNRSDEAIAAYDEVVARFGTAAEPSLCERVALALLNKGDVLGYLKRNDEAIAVYDNVVARFGEATEPELRKLVAKALLNKGVVLNRLARFEEATVAIRNAIKMRAPTIKPEKGDAYPNDTAAVKEPLSVVHPSNVAQLDEARIRRERISGKS